MFHKAKKEGGFKASMWDLILEGAGIFSERDEDARKSKVRMKVQQYIIFKWEKLDEYTFPGKYRVATLKCIHQIKGYTEVYFILR